MAARQVSLGSITFANDAPFVLIGGVNVLESRQFALDAAAQYAEVCRNLSIPLVFKASFDKANRSSIRSFRGPGLTDGLAMLQAVIERVGYRDLVRHQDAGVEKKKLYAALPQELSRFDLERYRDQPVQPAAARNLDGGRFR